MDTVATYTASDADEGDEETLTWSLTTGDNYFDIVPDESDPKRATVSFTDPPNYEAKSSYSYTVKVSDGNEEDEADTHSVTVTITDEDEGGTVTLMVSGGGDTLEINQTVTATLTDPDASPAL